MLHIAIGGFGSPMNTVLADEVSDEVSGVVEKIGSNVSGF
jgi:hypothetical protein